MYDIPVVSLTCDGAKANHKFYRMCAKQLKETPNIPYKSENTYRDGAEVYFFCDAPHLLKTAHNCFSKSFAHSKSHEMQV